MIHGAGYALKEDFLEVRLMVGHGPLKPGIEVRALDLQPVLSSGGKN